MSAAPLESPPGTTVVALTVAPDGTWLATGSSDRPVRVWDIATGRERALLGSPAGSVRAVATAAAPDGTWLATGSSDRPARIWDIATGRERAVLKNHTDCVTAVAVAPDGTWLATASRDGTARIWDAAGGHPRALLQVDGPLSACAWPSTDALAVGGSAGLYLFRFVPG